MFTGVAYTTHTPHTQKHNALVVKTDKLNLYREIIAACSEIHTKHINTLCGQNVRFLNVEAGGTYDSS